MTLTKQRLEALYKKYTAKQIASKLDINVRTVYSALKLHNIPKAVRNFKGVAVEPSFLKALSDAGYTHQEIASDHDISYEKVLSSTRGSCKILKEKLEHLYCVEKKGYTEIAQELGISPTSVWRYLKRYKLTRVFNPDKEEFTKNYIAMNIPALCEHYNESLDIIRDTIAKFELKRLTRPRKKKYSKEYITSLFKTHKYNFKEMQNILGLCEYSVKRLLRQHGLIPSLKDRSILCLPAYFKKPAYDMFLKFNEKYKAEWAKKEVAKYYNVPIAEIERCIKEFRTAGTVS